MTSDETQPAEAAEPVGVQLQKAREEQGLSISRIADAQHLRCGIIQAIESSDYAQIDSELFLKGYVRAYAKQVGLDSDAIIQDLNRELEPIRQQKERELEANPLLDIERRKRKKRRIGKMLLLVIAIALSVALIIVFVLPRLSTDEVASFSADPEATEESVEDTVETGPVDSDPGAALTADTSQAESPVITEPADAETGEAGVGDFVSDQEPALAPSTEPGLAEPLLSDDADEPTARLEIAFSGNCWVQVQDAAGNRLASAMKRAGDRLEVSGEPPLKVIVGAVNTVKMMRFDGEAVDIGDFPVTNNRSEFTLAI